MFNIDKVIHRDTWPMSKGNQTALLFRSLSTVQNSSILFYSKGTLFLSYFIDMIYLEDSNENNMSFPR